MIQYDHSTHTYRRQDGSVVPGVTEILRSLDLSPAYYSPKTLPDGRVVDAAEFGTAVHEECFAWERGEARIEDMDTAIQPYVHSYSKWLAMAAPGRRGRVEFEVAGVYAPVPYAGRCDRLTHYHAERVVDDIKTGGFYKHYLLQIAAYMRLFNACMGSVVLLQPDGTMPKVHHINRTDPAYETWLACARLWHWTHGERT